MSYSEELLRKQRDSWEEHSQGTDQEECSQYQWWSSDLIKNQTDSLHSTTVFL